MIRLKKMLSRLPRCFAAALAVCLASDLVFALLGLQPSGKRLALVLVAALLLALALEAAGRSGWWTLASLPAACALTALAAFVIWRCSLPGSAYREADNGKAALYGGKNVMAVVPHEDDDLNLLGGVIEQYVKYGSQVRIVFVTNGDLYGLGETRINEAITVCGRMGLPEENVIFLGYGDRWQGESHLYNAPPDLPMTSAAGYTATYGTAGHPAYHDGNLYTHRHLTEDLASVIVQYRPDVLFATDMDSHADHQAVSLFFDEALSQILVQDPDYRPLVLKGFAYSTAYHAPADYYEKNILSTRNPTGSPWMKENGAYLWDRRVRLPVLATTLSRSLLRSDAYGKIALYASQNATERSQNIINGDKVFWLRDVSSLSYRASVSASSGQAWRLNDFKLADSDQLISGEAPLDGAWTPESGDSERTAVLELAEQSDISFVRLYGPYPGQGRVLDALLTFDGGEAVHTGPLPEGGPLELTVDGQDVRRVSITLLETEGDAPGLSEVELYSRRPEQELSFIKLQDPYGNFIYDYYTEPGGQEEFSLYTVGCPALSQEDYQVTVDGEGCAAEIAGERLRVSCPQGKSCTVTVESRDGSVSDSVTVSNPSSFRLLGQRIEAFCRNVRPDPAMSTVRVNLRSLLRRIAQ